VLLEFPFPAWATRAAEAGAAATDETGDAASGDRDPFAGLSTP